MSALADMPDDDRFDGEDDAVRAAIQEEARPQIFPSVEIEKTVTASVAALRSDPQIFVRGGALTRVIESDGTEPGPAREIGAPVMRRAVPQWITERLSVVARFMKIKSEGRGDNKRDVAVPAAPPGWISAHVLARQTWPGYRALGGVVTSPTMRRNGTVLQEAGYDPESTLLYVPRGKYAIVPDAPTREDAIAARDRLLEVIDDFPLGDLARAGWLALLFTLCARELVEGSVPFFAVDAPVAGSGKGLLARTAHLIAFGAELAHMSLPPDDEEMRKQITTTLLGGDPAVLLDNAGVQIGGDSLESVITAPLWKVRLLGKNEDSGSLVPRVTWVVGGNGLEFTGDMGRRSLRIRIDTNCESPEEREDYRHPERAGEDKLLAWVREHRHELVVDALTILRAWHVAGRKGAVKRWGSFESWAATVGRAVQWVGLPDPTLGRATQDKALDPTRQALGVVYDAICRMSKDGIGVTAGELVRAAFPALASQPGKQTTMPAAADGRPPILADEDLAEAIGVLTPNSRGDAPTRARLLGRKLKAGRIINDYKLLATTGGGRSVRYSAVHILKGGMHDVQEVRGFTLPRERLEQ